MQNKKYSYLNPGDIIDIVATTPGIAIDSLGADLEYLANFVEGLGLVPRFDKEALLKGADFFSNIAQEYRQQDLHRALEAQDSKAIWFIRGGYGTSKLLPKLAQIKEPKSPKLLIGYSDINCLHLWVHKFWQWPSLHARVLYEFLHESHHQDLELLKEIIFGKQEQITYSNLIPLNKAAKDAQIITAPITGGTMQVIQTGIGLNWQFDAENKIVFFEELFDRGVRLERTLSHFMQLGLLDKAKAILFGDIICAPEANGKEICSLAIKNFAENMNIPVLSMPNIGHGELNYPLPLNTQSTLILNGNMPKLICDAGGK